MDQQSLHEQLRQALEEQQLSQLNALAEQAVTAFPQEAFGYYYKGEALLLEGRTDEAIPHIKKALTINDSLDYSLTLTLALLQNNDEEEARNNIEQLLEKYPENAELHVLAAAYFQGQTEAEEQLFSHLDRALSLNPEHLQALEMRAYALEAAGEMEKALDDIDSLIKLDTQSPAWRDIRISLLKKLGRQEEVEAEFRQLIAQNPEDIELRLSFGDYYMEIAEYKEAEYTYSDALDLEKREGGHSAYSLKKRGLALLRQNAYAKATEDFKKLIKIDDEDADGYLYLADIYLALTKKEMALNYLEIGLDMVADGRWRLQQKLGELYLEQEQWLQAEEAFTQMTRNVQGQAEGFFQLGLLYLRQGDMEAAYFALKEADENLHEKAEELMLLHCKKYMKADARLAEKDLMEEYEDEFPLNAQSPALQKAFGKIWKLDEKATAQKNEILGQLPPEMKNILLKAFQGMLVYLSPKGLLIFNAGKEDTRALYSIDTETGNKVTVEMLPLGRAVTQNLDIVTSDNQLALCGIGGSEAAIDLYFSPSSLAALPEAMRNEWKLKEEKGIMEFLGEKTS